MDGGKSLIDMRSLILVFGLMAALAATRVLPAQAPRPSTVAVSPPQDLEVTCVPARASGQGGFQGA